MRDLTDILPDSPSYKTRASAQKRLTTLHLLYG